jgi:hypothetical protein
MPRSKLFATITAAVAGAAALVSCAIANRITGGFGRVEGCMYYRDNVVPMTCIKRMAVSEETYTFSDLAACADERAGHSDSFAASSDAFFVDADGRGVQLKSCFFDGRIRRYYRYEEAREGGGAKLYIRELSCGDGCRDERSLYSLDISASGIKSKKIR